MNNLNVKIFLSYHKPSALLKSDIFVPIHVGRAIKRERSDFENRWLSEHLMGDDVGINISKKNLHFCELTAQYWAWKNLPTNVEYVGFMHYRRHLNFSGETYQENRWGLIEKEYLNADYIKAFGLDDENVRQSVQKYDVITANKWDVTNAKSKNNYDHYATSDPKLHIKDYDLALEIMGAKYPEYKNAAEKYNKMHYGYYTNIFVMRRDIFDKYCSWLFDILFELEAKVDISTYDFQEARIYGYISEWLFGIFLTHLQTTTDLKIKELQRTIVNNTDVCEPINICFASDDNYAKYMGVALSSILTNKRPQDDIHVYVLDGNISAENKEKIAELSSIAPFTIDYLKIDGRLFESFPLRGSNHFSIVTWYRLFLPSILPQVYKLLYLDCDIVVNTSLWPLYNTNITDNYLNGVVDIIDEQNCERLKIPRYVNAGVLLLNLDKMRQDNIQEKCFTYVEKNKKKILWNDQDVMNAVCSEKMEYVDSLWNVQITEYGGNKSDYFRALASQAYIMHFVSDKKPWKGKYSKWDKYYYQYVKLTPWHKDIRRYYKSRAKYIISSCLKTLFSLENVNNGEMKQLRILGIRIKFTRRTAVLRNECNDLRYRIDKANEQLQELIEQMQKLQKHNPDA